MAQTRLATYGTLAPGRSNHHQLENLNGTWTRGTVKGHLKQSGWGAAQGYPGLVLDPAGEDVEVFLFESDDLPAHWQRLDAFEGDGYQRVVVQVKTGDQMVEAYIYAVSGE